MPRSHPEGVAGASNDWTGAVIPFSSHAKMTNEIQICFSKWWENEKRNSNPFFKVMRKRKTKNEIRSAKPFFKVRAKTKNKKQNSNLFSNVMRKRKMEMALEFPFPMPRLALRYTHLNHTADYCNWADVSFQVFLRGMHETAMEELQRLMMRDL